MEFSENIVLPAALRKPVYLATLFAAAVIVLGPGLILGLGFIACSAVPVKLQCSEIKARIEYGDLTGDQLRFAQQELDDCQARQRAAEQKDSGLVESTEKRFTPESETESYSLPAGNGRLP